MTYFIKQIEIAMLLFRISPTHFYILLVRLKKDIFVLNKINFVSQDLTWMTINEIYPIYLKKQWKLLLEED